LIAEEWDRFRAFYWDDWTPELASFSAWIGPGAIEAAELLDACVRPQFTVQVWDQVLLLAKVENDEKREINNDDNVG